MTSSAHSLPLESEHAPVPFPLLLGIMTVVLTGGGLLLAIAGVQWGAAPATIPPMRLPWTYTHLALTAAIFCLWPMAALRMPLGNENRGQLLAQCFAIVLGATPAVVLGGVLATVSLHDVAYLVCTQGTFILIVMGVLAWRTLLPQAVLGMLLVMPITVIPLLAFVQNQFFPMLSNAWMPYAPLTLVGNMSEAIPGSAPKELVWAAVGGAIVGVGLFALAPTRRR